MRDLFHVAVASVVGRNHIEHSINNQDAVWCQATDDLIVGVLCDGCSGGNLDYTPNSEIGAKLQARVIGQELLVRVPEFGVEVALEMARARWLSTIIGMAGVLQEDLRYFVEHNMMATIMGVVITPEKTTIFRKGDGLYQINDEAPVVLDENNTPFYPAIGLFPGAREGADPHFQIEAELDTNEVDGIILGSDGADAFINYADHVAHADKPLGPLEQFYEPLFMRRPDLMQRRLTACGPWRGRYAKKNPLYDDTSLIRIQRIEPLNDIDLGDPEEEG